MKSTLENAVLTLVQNVLASSPAVQTANIEPVHYSTFIENWDSADDFPAITVSVLRRRPDGRNAIQERFYKWDVYIYIFHMATTYEAVTEVVEQLASIILGELEKNNILNSLSDSSNEKAYAVDIGEVDFQTQGFNQTFTGVARIYVGVNTSKLGPF